MGWALKWWKILHHRIYGAIEIVIATLWWGRCGKEVKTNTIQESQALILLVPFYLQDTLEEPWPGYNWQ